MIVMKFGGTSVGGPQRINSVCEIIRQRLAKKPVVVVSAVSGITDKLIAYARGEGSYREIEERHYQIIDALGLDRKLISKELKELKDLGKQQYSLALQDHIASFGERICARIVAYNLRKKGIPAKAYPAYELGFVTDDNFTEAEILPQTYQSIPRKLKNHAVPVVTGFIAKNLGGHITTLGRGGSDYTAAILGAAVKAEEIQIWTDVCGVMTSDPKIVKKACTVPILSFSEAAELAYFGAKILHPKTILPAMDKDIPVRVLNTYEPRHPGTLIVRETPEKTRSIKAIACKRNVTVVHIVSTRMLNSYGYMQKIYEIFAKHGIVVDLVATSEVSVSLTVNVKNLDSVKQELSQFAKVSVLSGKSIIAVVGDGLKQNYEIPARVFKVTSKAKINPEIISQGASEVNLSFVVNGEETDRIVKLLHAEFF